MAALTLLALCIAMMLGQLARGYPALSAAVRTNSQSFLN
jgi:hypothetical protein